MILRAYSQQLRRFISAGETPEPVLDDPETQSAVWDIIRDRFHFQNLSVDALAYAYENTLVEPEARKALGIHSTPAAVAEYIVKQLPFEVIDQDERKVFEPFSGHSVFLMTAMQRLRELLPSSMNPDERHKYFVRMLSGIERDGFAREVARLSLMLADYPNSDGWKPRGQRRPAPRAIFHSITVSQYRSLQSTVRSFLYTRALDIQREVVRAQAS